MTRYITIEEALTSIEEDGFLVVDLGLLLSALGRPQATVFGEDAYPTLWHKAAALLESLVRNHPIFGGNKRTALSLCATFLALNGEWLEPGEWAKEFTRRVAIGEIELDASAAQLKKHSITLK